jgi:hypothetical protein
MKKLVAKDWKHFVVNMTYGDDPYTLGKLRENFNQFLNKCFLRRLTCSTPLVGGPGATPGLSYYHPLRVVIFIAMASVKLLLLNSPMLPRLWRKTRPKNKPVC